MCQDPDRPSKESRHMRFFCIGFRCRNDVAICINLYLRGCIIHIRKYGLPYGLSVSLCMLHLMVTHFDATLGIGGWLDLTQQGLSPCKKYRTSWRSPAKSYQIIELVHQVSTFDISNPKDQNIIFYVFLKCFIKIKKTKQKNNNITLLFCPFT